MDNYQVEVLLTLAAVTGGYALASELHVSGPLAMVVAGVIIGNRVTAYACYNWTPPLAGFLLVPQQVTLRGVITEPIQRQQ